MLRKFALLTAMALVPIAFTLNHANACNECVRQAQAAAVAVAAPAPTQQQVLLLQQQAPVALVAGTPVCARALNCRQQRRQARVAARQARRGVGVSVGVPVQVVNASVGVGQAPVQTPVQGFELVPETSYQLAPTTAAIAEVDEAPAPEGAVAADGPPPFDPPVPAPAPDVPVPAPEPAPSRVCFDLVPTVTYQLRARQTAPAFASYNYAPAYQTAYAAVQPMYQTAFQPAYQTSFAAFQPAYQSAFAYQTAFQPAYTMLQPAYQSAFAAVQPAASVMVGVGGGGRHHHRHRVKTKTVVRGL